MPRMSWCILDLSGLDHYLAPSCKMTLSYSHAMPLFSVSAYWMFKVWCITFTLAVITNAHWLVCSCQIAFSLLHMICYWGCFCCHHLPFSEFFPLFTTPLPFIHLFSLQLPILAKVVLSSRFFLEGCLADTAKLFPETSSSFLWPADNFSGASPRMSHPYNWASSSCFTVNQGSKIRTFCIFLLLHAWARVQWPECGSWTSYTSIVSCYSQHKITEPLHLIPLQHPCQ